MTLAFEQEFQVRVPRSASTRTALDPSTGSTEPRKPREGLAAQAPFVEREALHATSETEPYSRK